MKYIRDLNEIQITEPTVFSLGKFDGIHRGHERLMDYLVQKQQEGYKTVVFTFDMPSKHKQLTTSEEKKQLLESYGIDYLIEIPFTPEFKRMEPEAFVAALVKNFHVKYMVIGTDFRFGHNRRGDYRLLQELADVYEYEVQVVEKVTEHGRDISSTYIRNEIEAGNIEHANALLGYDFFVQGTVVYGNQIGRTLKMPTANLILPEEKLLPPFGVYVTRTRVGGEIYGGITNVGCKPTIEGINPIGVETHLFDFDKDIYGEEIRVEFICSVRKEVKFHSMEALKEQMQKDMAYGKEWFCFTKE